MKKTVEQQIRALIGKGEGIDIEFKTCRNKLNRDVYETICAFLNRHGGTLLLGVTDAGNIDGIDPDALEDIRKNFVTAINNPQKISPPTYLSINEETVDDKKILRIYVPESSQVHRCNGRIYDRNEDGDLDITDQTVQVARLYQRKQVSYSENKVYSWIQPHDLRKDLMERCREYLRINHPDHPWTEMKDDELLKSAQLLQTDMETGKTGITLAGVMLFGSDDLILKVCPAHRTDLILRKVNVDRYDDRELVRTNLIESYDRIMAFIKKHLADPFYLEGTERRSLRDIIFREVASNMLVHREYASGATSRLIIEYGKVVTDNPSRPHGFGLITETNVPFQKNPILSAFFRVIDRADELGSGMRKMMLWGKAYGGADPQLIEGDNFRMVISVPEFGDNPVKKSQVVELGKTTGAQSGAQLPTQSRAQSRAQSGAQSGAQSIDVLTELFSEGEVSASELATKLGLKSKTGAFKRTLQNLLEDNQIEYTIPENPNSRLQKYRLTEIGRQVIEGRGLRLRKKI